MSHLFLWAAYMLLSAVALVGAVVAGLNGDTPSAIAFTAVMWFFSNRSNSVEDMVAGR